MKKIFSRLKSTMSQHNFFREEDLCPPETALSRFSEALEKAREYYKNEKGRPIDPALIHGDWQDNIARLEAYFLNSMDKDFISNEVINGTMVFTDKKAHAIELEKLSSSLDKRAVERIIGKGLNTAFIAGKSRKGTAINSVHHLYHLTQFERMTGRKIASIRSVVEFGGGYGNMARIVENFGKVESYSIIDLLLFSCIQYIFLCATAGANQTAFSNSSSRKNEKFILHPLSLTDSMKELRGELFISTWALSESTRAAYDLVTQSDWFGAANLLLAYNTKWKPWHENELSSSLEAEGWRVAHEAIPFLPESFYLCATR